MRRQVSVIFAGGMDANQSGPNVIGQRRGESQFWMMFWARLSQSRVKEINIDVTLDVHQFLARLRVFRTQIEHCLKAGSVDAQITVDAIGGIGRAVGSPFDR